MLVHDISFAALLQCFYSHYTMLCFVVRPGSTCRR